MEKVLLSEKAVRDIIDIANRTAENLCMSSNDLYRKVITGGNTLDIVQDASAHTVMEAIDNAQLVLLFIAGTLQGRYRFDEVSGKWSG